MTQPLVPPPTSPPPASWLRRRVLQPLLDLLKQGLTPHQLALTAALGSAFGLVPMLGVTTLMSTVTAVRLRLNVAAMLLIAHLWSPVQLLLIIPMMRLGARLWGSAGPALTLAKLQHLFSSDWLAALRLLWHALLGALALWAVGSVVLGTLFYFVLRPILSRVMARKLEVRSER
ncbi:DUF2062 domain-containing protein [Hymenobacter weizhouensis]|uniref:DUF2062 domain-containing protein n=1 Tax=Hymenobacter sp. YIM 151500-1 TaxID=2987689 RepID=UPI00222750A9|nr:DUF2062 domain-containing protein [Hymenobacter sp. YIM 151500-1]UYZ63840.1 DUF2062 domain-containing protein [Hymenobacter sp. YIM 151500-1]